MKKRALSLLLCLLCVLPLFSACSGDDAGYVLADDDMRRYFSMERTDYTGQTIPVSSEYEVTDATVEDYINTLLDEHRHAIPGKRIADGDIVGLYMRVEYDGKTFPVSGFSNYSAAEPNYTLIAADGDMMPEVRAALLGEMPEEYSLREDFGGTVRADSKIVFTYYKYYVENGKQIEVAYNARGYYDLSGVTKESDPLLFSAIGQPVGEIYAYEETVMTDGGETRKMQYNCLVNCTVDEEKAIVVRDAVLPADAFPDESENAYLNGACVTVYVVPTGVYQMATLDENFLLYELEYEPPEDESDVVAAFRRSVRKTMETEMASKALYDEAFAYMFARLRPTSYPEAMHLDTQIPEAVDAILTSSDYADAAAYYNMELEDFIRQEIGLSEGVYADLPLRDAMIRYTYDSHDREMLICCIAQAEGLMPTDEEYRAYLQSYVDQLIAAGQTTYTPETLEAYYDSRYGTGYLREYLTYSRVADFLYRNNTFAYTE